MIKLKTYNNPVPNLLGKEAARCSIKSLEDALSAFPESKGFNCDVQHDFASGQYARTIFIKEGDVIVGKIHRHDHINVISQGEIICYTEFDSVTYKAPVTFVSHAGSKRCVRALSDTVWTTVHSTQYKSIDDLDKIEQETIADDYSQLEGDL